MRDVMGNGLMVAVVSVLLAGISAPAHAGTMTLTAAEGLSATGTAGGPSGLRERFTGVSPFTDCQGWGPQAAQHELTLAEESRLQVMAEPRAGGDLTLVIEGPGGVLCNDDFRGLDPGMVHTFPAGTYRVWVGTYSPGQSVSYALSIETFPEPEEATTHRVRAGDGEILRASGAAGGPRQGNSWQGVPPHTVCRGWMPDGPQHELVFEEQVERVELMASPASGGDLTMVVEGPRGVWCNDDYRGLDPGIVDTFPAGTYRVWVGTYSQGAGPLAYTLTASVQPPPPEPTRHSLAPGFLPDPWTAASLAGGPRASGSWTPVAEHDQCRGTLPEQPQHILELGAFEFLRIVARPDDNRDLTMVIEGPGGVWCNDDFEGLNPGFETTFPAGTYRIFVGVFGSSPQVVPYTLHVSEL